MTIYQEIVADYIQRHRNDAEKEQRCFEIQRTLEATISLAALAKGPGGKRLSHQRRIPESALSESRSRLLEALSILRQARSFEELYETISSLIRSIPGIGELTVYDTALRIGSKLGHEPAVVFLHAGTRKGARCLGLNVSREFIPVSELPRAFQRLKPREIEDVLCIYKAQLCKQHSAKPSQSRSCA